MKRYLSVWAHLLRLSWRLEPRLTCAMFATLTLNVVAVAGIALALRAIVNNSMHGHLAAAVVGAVGAAAGYGLMSVIGGLLGNLRILLVERVGMTDLQEQIQLDIATIDGLEHLENPGYLDRVTVVGGAAWGLTDGLWAAITTVFTLLQLAVSLVVLGQVNPWLVVLLAMAAAPIWAGQRGESVVRAAEISSAEQYRLQEHLFDLATSAGEGKEVRVAGVGEQLARLQTDAWRAATGVRGRARLVAALWRFGGWSVFSAAFVGGLALVTHQAQRGDGSIGDIVLMITIAASLRQSVQTAVSRASDTAGAGRLIVPYLWLRDHAAGRRASRGAAVPAPDRLTEGIDLDRVTYTYPGTTAPAMDEVSLHIPAGSVVAVVGEYGSGKTTLVKMLAKFYQPDAGTVRVDGTSLAELDTDSWHARLACAFQDFGRFHVRAREVVGLGDPAFLDDDERVRAAVRTAEAHEIFDRMPDGLDTQLGRELGGIQLSEGQWQRTALARASMRRQPLLFVLDEPTASLDAFSEHAIFQSYMSRARALAAETGGITVIVSHRFSTVTGADLIVVLHQGRLAEVGSHQELLAAGGRYAELYAIQGNAYTDPSPEA
ncbi:ABC transporter ATP-binding protein [Streptomyces sp. DSM 44915]|uniref:ABC transporter ATP-binding protein n=1 Tax=Streptomyces chisholmiae TaxID=3075540 RepID=A0ABU2JUS6_9ACTN|nr:ABC transporter ATP-binding protein [Streptomyces sp. DSM 44915]MDT0268736.1 ABC transporter ATP-binding protein [Streptomyces sp. DSM 44915]